MASGSSFSVHSCEDSFTEESKCIVKSISNNILLLSSEIFKPFNSNLKTKVAHPHTVGHIQSSVLSISDRFIKSLHCFAFQNPFLKNISSLKYHFATFIQSGCKDSRGVNSLSNHGFATILPNDSVAGLVVSNGTMNFLNIYNTLLVVRLVLTWFPNSPPAIVAPLSTLCDPYLNIFRGLIPPLGGSLDLSPILAFIVLNAVTSTAAALPAELPSPLHQTKDNYSVFCQEPTASQKKWMRMFGKKTNSPPQSSSFV